MLIDHRYRVLQEIDLSDNSEVVSLDLGVDLWFLGFLLLLGVRLLGGWSVLLELVDVHVKAGVLQNII